MCIKYSQTQSYFLGIRLSGYHYKNECNLNETEVGNLDVLLDLLEVLAWPIVLHQMVCPAP